MEYTDGMLEYYGVNPPETSKPFWGSDGITEDDIVTSIDFKISFKRLSQHEQKVLKLFNQGFTTDEIAEIAKIPRSTAHDTKERAIGKMREWLS